jgi:glycosyltransferase involved in cell wall biosynthesis
MNVLCLVDFPIKEGDQWIWNSLPSRKEDVINFIVTSAEDRSPRWGKILNYYPHFFRQSIKAYQLSRGNDYDLIIAWEGKNGFPYALIRRLFHQQYPPFVILSFSIRGILTQFKRLQKFGINSVDCVIVPTDYERQFYKNSLKLPLNRIYHCPHGVYDPLIDNNVRTFGGYIFSGGRSGRDYGTLVNAVNGLDIPLIINARSFNLGGITLPPNVKCNPILPVDQYRDLNLGARFVVVPLQALSEAVGITAALDAMAAGKAVIASRVSGIDEYVIDGETGVIVSPGDSLQMRVAIEHMWDNPDGAQAMGDNARKLYEEKYTFEKFSNRVYEILSDINERSHSVKMVF